MSTERECLIPKEKDLQGKKHKQGNRLNRGSREKEEGPLYATDETNQEHRTAFIRFNRIK